MVSSLLSVRPGMPGLGFLLLRHLSVIIEPATRDTSLPVRMPTGNTSRMTSRPDYCVGVDGRDIIAVEIYIWHSVVTTT